MTDINITIPDRVILWQTCLKEGDVKAAIVHHDIASEHIMKHQDGAKVFQLAKLDPQGFIEFSKFKETIRTQLEKTAEQLRADFNEGVMQLQDLVEKIQNSKNPAQVAKWIETIQASLRQVMINASCLDSEAEPENLANGETETQVPSPPGPGKLDTEPPPTDVEEPPPPTEQSPSQVTAKNTRQRKPRAPRKAAAQKTSAKKS